MKPKWEQYQIPGLSEETKELNGASSKKACDKMEELSDLLKNGKHKARKLKAKKSEEESGECTDE